MNNLTRIPPQRSFKDNFPSIDHFFRWVATYHGQAVSDTCRKRIEEAKTAGREEDPQVVLNDLVDAPPAPKLPKEHFRVKFVW